MLLLYSSFVQIKRPDSERCRVVLISVKANIAIPADSLKSEHHSKDRCHCQNQKQHAAKKDVQIFSCDNRQTPDTLINRILHYLYDTGAYRPAQEQSFTPALCNRLDRNTGGIVIAAKTAAALREVNRLIRENRIRKTYLCVTVGTPRQKQAVLHAWHQKSASHNTVTILDKKQAGFQEIITGYRVLAANERHALLAVDLITGRTHQIRAHLAHIGTPILGDTKYGNMRENRDRHCKYQLLWAYQITLEPYPDTCLSDLNGMTIRTAVPSFVTKEFPDVLL